jgi:hypothetical protein
MKTLNMVLLIVVTNCFTVFSQVNYGDWFTGERMRVDLYYSGNHEITQVFFKKIKKEPRWGGTRTNLLDPMGFGHFQVRITDKQSGKLIFTRGFSTLWEEWQTTAESKITDKSMSGSVVFPYPKKEVIFELFMRDEKNRFVEVFDLDIDPGSIFIETNLAFDFPVKKVLDNGDPAHRVDLAFVAEGYTREQMSDFEADVMEFSEHLFDEEPFGEHRDKFNIWAVFSESVDEGTDIPGDSTWKNTIMNTNFYTFGSERYMMTYDFSLVSDVVANVPYDQIFILVNTDKYGGGGVYNNYCVSSSGNSYSLVVMVHEFGHGFGGLGDEYYTSSTAYEEFFDLTVEPWEPNLTTMVDFESKWADLVDADTPIPTPAEKQYLDKTGVFEGGGYVSKGVFRPAYDCRMKSNEAEGFCEVCRRVLTGMIRYHTE